MSATHLDETTLLRSVLGDLPARRQAGLRRHVERCRQCREEREKTKRLHERLSGAGDSLAFPATDAFDSRPVFPGTGADRGAALKGMAVALGRLEREKDRLTKVFEADAAGAARALDLSDAATRLAVTHLLEGAVEADPSEHLVEVASGIVERVDGPENEAEAVLPLAQLRAVARLVLGHWRLFCGEPAKAGQEFGAAWSALGAFDAPEHLVAWTEVGESFRRSYEGRAAEGRLLAERALDTFERYGLGRGVVRSRHARAVALYCGGEPREGHRAFRAVIATKVATRLDRARAVSGAAFCFAARGRFRDAAKEYSRIRCRSKGDGAAHEQCLLQGEMKACLGTAGRWHTTRRGEVAFALPESGGALHARQIAAEIVKLAGEQGIEAAKSRIEAIEADPSRGYALLYAAQLAMPKVSSDPAMYVELAKALASASRSLPFLKDKGPAQPVCREQVMGEAQLLESNALNYRGLPVEARAAAGAARASFIEAGEDSFALALVDYYEGSAASFENDERGAWSLLRRAHSEFQVYGQENWTGRAEAALGTVLVHRGRYAAAVRFLDGALANLHPELDGSSYAQTLVNRGYALVQVGRLEAAKATYAKALLMARRLGMATTVLMIRTGLASIDLASGKLGRALMLFERIGGDARTLDLAADVLCSELRIAECLGRMGRNEDMLDRIERVSGMPEAASLRHDPALRELFASVEDRSVSYELLAHVARFVEARDRGAQAAYRPFRLVVNGN